jgi:hypothetical protein
MPMTKPAVTPINAWVMPANEGMPAVTLWPRVSTTATAANITAMTRYRVAERRRIAQPAPNQAPSRLPANRLAMTKRQRRCDHDEAHGLVQDHRFQRCELEYANEQG